MTICISSICSLNGGTTPDCVVFCADKLISSSVNFESGISKYKYILNRAIILEAGDASFSDIVLDKWIYSLDTSQMDICEIADELNKRIINLRIKQIEDTILSKFAMTYQSFLSNSANIEQSLFFDLIKRIDNFYLGIEFIVSGLDKDGTPHLYVVSDEGGIRCYDSIGFIAIGSGSGATLFDITKSAHNNNISASEAFVRVYGAKKAAQRVTGVGQETDLGLLFLKEKVDNEWLAEIGIATSEITDKLDAGIEKLTGLEKQTKETIKTEIDTLIYNKKEEKKETSIPTITSSSEEQSSHPET